ncbi:MAG: DeoR/GlpR transcriptional regulator [Spirochaetales bacterium]|nr:DeoR/GlpR transcriptional regulator [Spirochaetales bacterium]
MHQKIERLNKVIQILRASNIVRIRELARILKVSEMTIRRDLDLLYGEGIINLIPGGAILKKDGHPEAEKTYYLDDEKGIRIEEKNRIGKKAASLIDHGDIVIIDSGSTTERMVGYMPQEMEITVLCYSLNILLQLYRRKLPRLIFAGGYFHEDTAMFESPEGVQLIHKNRANKAFIAAGGVSDKLGVTTPFHFEVPTKRAAIDTSHTRVLMVDSSKFGKIEAAYFAELTEFDVIITDRGIDKTYLELIQESEIEILLV